jgi:hypothetical protein
LPQVFDGGFAFETPAVGRQEGNPTQTQKLLHTIRFVLVLHAVSHNFEHFFFVGLFFDYRFYDSEFHDSCALPVF